METRAKLPKKLLSLFLSVLMAFSCFAVALPGLVPESQAASWNQWNDLRNAFNDAYNHGQLRSGNAGFSVSGDTVTLNDGTDRGYLYRIAECIFSIARSDNGSANHNSKMRAYIKNNVGMSLNGYQNNFIDNLFPLTGDGAGYTDGNQKDRYNKNSWSDPPGISLWNRTYTVTVTRTVDAAIRRECSTLDSVPAQINTKVTFTINAIANTRTWHEKRPWYEPDRQHRFEWYVNNQPSYAYTKSNTPSTQALKNYIAYVNDGAKFHNGYNEYLSNPDVLYGRTIEELNAVAPAYTPYRNAINGTYRLYFDLYYNFSNVTSRDNYVNACTSTAQVLSYKPYVEWIKNGNHIDGKIDRDDYATDVRVPANLERMKALREQATQMKNLVESATPDAKAVLRDRFGYNVNDFINYINKLTDYIEVYELTDIYDEVKFRMENDETKTFNGNSDLWGAINYESSLYEEGACPVDNAMLTQVEAWFRAKVNAINARRTENINKVFTDVPFSEVKAFSKALTEEKAYRNYKDEFDTDYYVYFEEFRATDFSKLNDQAVIDRIKDAEAKLTSLNNTINNAKYEMSQAKVDLIYGNYASIARMNVDEAYRVLLIREYELHHRLLEVALDLTRYDDFDGTAGDSVGAGNFSLVKRAVVDIRDNTVLWNWYNANKGKLKNLDRTKCDRIDYWNTLLPEYDAAVERAIAEKWKFTKISLDKPAGSGYYTTRYPMGSDMIRTVGKTEDNYVVTEDKINLVITKLDRFLKSEDFAKLIGVYRETPEYNEQLGITMPAVKNLSEFIESLLLEKLFNDGMINTIIAGLFPMMAEKLTGVIKDLLGSGLPGAIVPPRGNADGTVNLPDLVKGVPDVSIDKGVADIFVDGNPPTRGATPSLLSDVFAGLGIKVFPHHLANAMGRATNPAFYDALKAAGNDWMYFDRHGDNNGKVEAADLKDYKWNVTGYDSFIQVAGQLFNAVLPILRTVLTNGTLQTGRIPKLASVYGTNIDVHYKGIGAELHWLAASADVKIKIGGIQGYNNLYAPIVESLLGDYTPSTNNSVSLDRPLSSTLGTAGNNVSAQELVAGLFMPLYALVKKVADKPIDTVLGLLPNLTQYISYNCIQPLLGVLNLNVSLDLYLMNIDLDGAGFLGNIIQGLKGLLNNILNDKAIAVGPIAVNLAEQLTKEKLDEMVGADISDLNAILDKFLNKPAAPGVEHKPVGFPAINSGHVSRLGTLKTYNSVRTQNFNSSLGGGKRYFIEADKADMLYDLLSWLLGFASMPGNLSGLLVNLGKEPLNPDIEALISGIDPEGALAALVELFVPQDYAETEYKWFRNGGAGDKFNLTSADFVYLKYANNWTREKSKYMYDNLDSVVNSVINMVDPTMLQGKEGINQLLREKIISIFDNKGIMNVINLVVGIGNSLADKPEIVQMVKDQIQTGGKDAQIDLMSWYNSFGYLIYDYTQVDPATGVLPVTAPKKPGDAGYVNYFPNLAVDVLDTGTTDPQTGKPVINYQWYYKGVPLTDGSEDAREIFTHIFSELIRPLAPIFSLLLTDKDLSLFANAIVINSYNGYRSAIVPLLEVMGIYDLKTQAEYNAYCEANGAAAGFDYLVQKLFDRVSYLLEIETKNIDGVMVTYGPLQKIVDFLPNLFYFLQSGGLSVLLKNILQPIWGLIDTVRPIADVDLDAFLHKFLCSFLKLNYDVTDEFNYPTSPVVELLAKMMNLNPVFDASQAAKDKPIVDGIFDITIEDLTMESIISVVKMMFNIDLAPIQYAFEGMCIEGYEADGKVYGVKEYASKSGKQACRLDYNGADTVTVLISVLLDILRYGDNAKNLDKMLDLVKPEDPNAPGSNVTAQGLLDALLVVFKDKVNDTDMISPNWDYLVEGKTVELLPGGASAEWVDADYENLVNVVSLDKYHSINNLKYVTDWTEDTAKATDEVLKVILDYIVPMIDKNNPPAADFETFVNNMLNTKVYSGELLKTIAGALAKLFNTLPVEVVGVVDKLLEVNMNDWYKYVSLQDVEKTDADGKVTVVNEFAARPDHEWWADPTAAAYVDTKDEFVAAAKAIILPAAKVFGLIFLGDEYRLFYTMDEGPGTPEYGDDAIVLDGASAYAKGLIPLLEALGMDLSAYKPEKYNLETDPAKPARFDNELFVNDFFDIVVKLLDTIIADPVNWLIDALPGIVYYVNANGLSTALENVFGSVREVIDAVNTMLPADKQIDLKTLIPGVDLTQLNLSGIFKLIETKTGLHVRADLEQYMKDLYVGNIKAFVSANGQTAFTMEYSSVEERHDMITILLALVLELVEDKGEYEDAEGNKVAYDNPAALDKLLAKPGEEPGDMVQQIVNALTNPESVVYKDINWNYFDEKIDLADKTQNDGTVLVPGYAYQYLNYTTDWTYDKAVKAADGFEGLLLGILGMTGKDVAGKTLGQVLKEMAGITTLYSGETLQKLLDTVRPLLFGKDAAIPSVLVELLGCMLGAELTQWNNEYAFETRKADQTYTPDAAAGLDYRMADIMQKVVNPDGTPALDAEGKEQFVPTGEKIKTYAIETQEDFINGTAVLFQPAERLLSWLFFGDSYEFFNGNTDATADDVLITLNGTEGYREGLALLLEALGCNNLKKESEYKTVSAEGVTTVDMSAFIKDVASSLTTRIEELLDDPANEIVNLIPELLYFINAGGLQVSINNILAGPLALVNQVAPITGKGANLDEIVQTVLRDALKNQEITFTMDGINLQYIFTLAEALTGLEITEVAGNKLDKFYMGEIYKYPSATDKLAYRMRFSNVEDFADFITILLSFVVDIALYDGNAAAIAKLAKIEPGMVQGIVNFLKSDYTVPIKDIDWFYFDNTVNADGLNPGDKVVLPERTINYLTYASDWTEEKADYVFQHRNDIIAAALSMMGKGDTTVADIIAEKFDLNRDLYTAKNLNMILNKVKELTAGLDAAITDLAGLIIDVDLTAYKTMPLFTDEQITDRNSFVTGLTKVIAPIYRILDWLLFADNMEFFDKKVDVTNPDSAVEVLLTLKGSEGYAYGLVPILEALGVYLPPFDPMTAKTEDIFFPFVNNILARIEAILANPVDEVLALLPNLIYFINTNALSACVNNLLGGIFVLLDEVNKVLPPEKQISIDDMLSKALGGTITLDMDKLDLLALVGVAEQATGLKIADVVTAAKIDKFYLGQMEYFTSSNGKPAFRMVYSEKEGGAEMLTVLLNFVLELVLYKDAATGKTNAEVLETMLGKEPGTVQKIIDIIPTLGAEPNYTDYDWNYMGGTVDPQSHAITLPKTPFLNYFTYETTWTQEKANYIYDNMDSIITAVLQMTGAPETADTVKEILDQKFNLYTAANLNMILEKVKVIYTKVDKRLLDVAGVVLGVDLTAWDGMEFKDADIYDAETFVNGVVQIISPVYTLLDWLLFSDNIEYFVKSEDGTTVLLKVAGTEGYKKGLVPLLEALGVKLPEIKAVPSCANMFKDVLTAIFARIDNVLANPIDEVLALIPNILYFINANGVSTAVTNLLASVLNIVEALNAKGIANINLTELLGGIDITKLDLAAIFNIVETKVPAIAGLKINDAFKGNVNVNADGTVTFVHDVNGENIIEKFYLGSIESFVSTNKELAYRMVLPEGQQGDLLTFILSFALDLVIYGDNSKVIDKMANLPEGTVGAIVTILASKMEFTMGKMDWVYFLNLTEAEKEAKINEVLSGKINNLPALPDRTLHYIEYDNNWNEETAEYLVTNLPDIADLVINMATDYVDLDALIADKVDIYSDATVNMIIGKIANMVKKVPAQLLETLGTVLDADLNALVNYKAEGVYNKETFVAALSEAFGNIGFVLDWLLFNRDMTFFTKLEDGTPAKINLAGNEGYKYGLAPLLQAIGVDTHITVPAATETVSVTEQILPTVLTNVCDRIDEIFADPINEVIDLLLELLYFINADGVRTCALNLVAPVNDLLDAVVEKTGNQDLSFASLIKFDIGSLNLEGICKILKDKTGIDVFGAVGDYLGNFYFGELEYYESYDGIGGFHMVYTATEQRHDMITIVLSVVLDTLVYPGNKDAIVKMLGEEKGEDIYKVIMAFLTNNTIDVPMQPYGWILKDKADTGEVISPITGNGLYDYMYGPLYTREMGAYITKWLPHFIDTMIVLLGIENKNGGNYKGLEDILDQLLGKTIYKAEYVQKILETVQGLIVKVKDAIGPELFNHAATILNSALGVDLTFWDNYQIGNIPEGDRAAFVNEVVKILTPAYPILQVILTSEDLAFFNKDTTEPVPSDKNSYVVIKGAEGYAYAIIPLLEALHCENVKTPDEYKAAIEADPANLMRNIIDPLLDKVDTVLADPVNEIFNILPGLIYFVNSNGLDTMFKNLINAGLDILKTVEPITGEIDLYEKIGFDFQVNIEGLIDQALQKVEKDTGFTLTKVAMEAIIELTAGKVVSFTSKNGETAYTMEYVAGADKADLVTIILRLILTFVSIDENVVALEAILKDKLDAEGYKFVCSLLENFNQMVDDPRGMDEVMYTVYWIFYSANVAATETENWLGEFNGDYSFLNQLFATSDLEFLKQLEKSFGDLLNKYTGDIIDDDELAPNGFIKFFKKIIEFFNRIIEMITNLFK